MSENGVISILTNFYTTMAYTEVKKTGYGSRVGSSFKGIGSGVVMFIGATVLLWWNEGRAVHTAQDIAEMGKNAVHVDNISSLDASLNGQLIHVNGTTATTDVLTDGLFGVSANAIALNRKVEYYQWVEHSHTETKEKLGGTKEEITTYTYDRAWVSSPVESSSFKDPDYKGVNTVLTQIDDQSYRAQNVTLGAYTMPQSMISSLSYMNKHNTTLSLSYEVLSGLNNDLVAKLPAAELAALKSIQSLTGNDSIAALPYVHQAGNQLYLGRDMNNPAVGDIRVSFEQADPCDISLVAVVDGNTFAPYKTKNGSNDTFLHSGTKTLEQMVQSEEEGNNMLTWVLRIVGLFLVCAGLKGVFGFLVTILKVVPFLANILNWGVNLVCNVIGFAWTLIIVALAWIFYRPLLGISLLVIAGVLVYFLAIKGKGKKNEVATA